MASDEENYDHIEIELPGMAEKIISQRKLDYAVRLGQLLDEFDRCLIVNITNVGSKQIADMRKDLRGRATFLFGKNTLIRKVIRDYVKLHSQPNLMTLMESMKGNVGLVFTKEEVGPLRKELEARQKQCAAKAGVVSPVDVVVPADYRCFSVGHYFRGNSGFVQPGRAESVCAVLRVGIPDHLQCAAHSDPSLQARAGPVPGL